MCGIAGSLNFSLDSSTIIESLQHRGPDDSGIFSDDHCTLIHTRLSIQDIQGGHQPMREGHHLIVFNGEIYNHLELRKQYLSNESFRTHSDTETLLKLLLQYGVSCLEWLDGMFAFALYDTKKKQLQLIRDRAGKKPLYYYHQNNQLVFASELNTLRKILDLQINEQHIADYVRMGYFFRNTTAYQNVQAVKNGQIIQIDSTGQLQTQTFFDIADFYQTTEELSTEEALQKTQALLEKSVQDRLLSSDLEAGAFLSGGIDSSLIVALASKYTHKLKTFTVKFDGAYDESHLARLTAQKYQTDHHEISISMNLRDDIETILQNYGQPFFDSSAIPSYYVSRESKKHVTVILNGDGADELFGGYRRYVPFASGLMPIAKSLRFLQPLLPSPKEKKSLYNYAYRLLELADKTDPLEFYLSATTDIWEGFQQELAHQTSSHISSFILKHQKMNISELSQMLLIDSQLILFGDLLIKMDIATMAHSLEGRSPFLSKYLLEFAPTLSDSMKVKGKSTKWILRELGKKLLPLELIHQPKRGFEVPLKQWVGHDLKENIFDSLTTGCYSEHFVQRSFIDSLLQEQTTVPDEKRAKMLWNLYCLEVWYLSQKT